MASYGIWLMAYGFTTQHLPTEYSAAKCRIISYDSNYLLTAILPGSHKASPPLRWIYLEHAI